jgi:long-chain acyl-CoA synthetase
MIIRGGFNIYPREIEEVLYGHPAVLEAAVVGVPHPTHGEEVAAAITLRPAHTVSPEQLRDHVKARVAAYKYPRHVWLVVGNAGVGEMGGQSDVAVVEADDMEAWSAS